MSQLLVETRASHLRLRVLQHGVLSSNDIMLHGDISDMSLQTNIRQRLVTLVRWRFFATYVCGRMCSFAFPRMCDFTRVLACSNATWATYCSHGMHRITHSLFCLFSIFKYSIYYIVTYCNCNYFLVMFNLYWFSAICFSHDHDLSTCAFILS